MQTREPNLKKPKATLVVLDPKRPDPVITFQVTPAKIIGAKQVLPHGENPQTKRMKTKKASTARLIDPVRPVAPVKMPQLTALTKQMTSKHVTIARKSHVDLAKVSVGAKTCKKTITLSTSRHKNSPSLVSTAQVSQFLSIQSAR